MSKVQVNIITGFIEQESPYIQPNGWLDYMNKDFSWMSRQNDALVEVIDRARIVLNEYDNIQIQQSIDVINMVVSVYFGDDDELNNVLHINRGQFSQKLFQRKDISEPLALLTALKTLLPLFYLSTRGTETQDQDNPSWYGINPKDTNSQALYLAILAIRDAFASARYFLDASSYTSLDFTVDPADYGDNQDIAMAYEDEANDYMEELQEICLLASNKTMRAMEAISLAENIISNNSNQHNFEIHKEKTLEIKQRARTEVAIKAANKRHSGTRKLKKYAIDKFKNNTYKSTRQASFAIFPQVQEYSSKINVPPLSNERAQITVYEWLLEAK